jgi:RNA polymerase sigma-70 factor (ECF subfamily)
LFIFAHKKKLYTLEQEIDLIELKAGNAKVYETLFKQFYEPLCRYAFSILQNDEEVEDVVQDIFCKLWDQRDKMDIHTSIKSYLYRMVHNICLNKIKQTQIRSEHHEHIAYISVMASNNVEYEITHKELSRQIALAIAELPERCRQVFQLSRMKHLSYAEIGQEMKISHNTVETQMVKALKTLRIKLKDYLVFALIFFLTNIN